MGYRIGKRTGLVVGLVLAGLTSGTARGELVEYAFSGYLTEVDSVLKNYETTPPTPMNFLPGVTVGSTFSGTLTFDLSLAQQAAAQGQEEDNPAAGLNLIIDNNISIGSLERLALGVDLAPPNGLYVFGEGGGGDIPVRPYIYPDYLSYGLEIRSDGTGTLFIHIHRNSNHAPGDMTVLGNVTSFVPVPEPSSLVLGIVGLGTAAAGRAYRRRERPNRRGASSRQSA